MRYRIEFHQGGILRKVFEAHGEEKGLIGDYVGGRPYGPVPDSIEAGLPYAMRPAFWRDACGWYRESPFPHWRYDLWRKRDGAPLGTVFATLIREESE